ncbi:GntR family transcriptional regulator [Cytobacillus depressus]|uniref:GntR family transcriptional regulator n=1 Tax=Cytobacillus depressus TaxID=1602942 RepID=A0A6L3V060_9BACI|nr:GntR family transcriptional regulator [Cytobacillus depressus]KAB2330430.1 GntR family transcriptional regulator [Cytobacillus depressus]
MKQSNEFHTLQEKVTSIIREAIFTQEFKPGERLIQDELATRLGVSRMPVREALRCLEREGLVIFLPHKGAQVIGISKEDIEELYYLRSMLEGITVQKSMSFLTTKDRAELQSLVDSMDIDIENDDMDSYMNHNQQFHSLLQKGCKWKKTKILTKELIEGYPSYVPILIPKTVVVSNKEHKQILAALDEKDPIKLKLLVENHIMRAGNMLLEFIED